MKKTKNKTTRDYCGGVRTVVAADKRSAARQS